MVVILLPVPFTNLIIFFHNVIHLTPDVPVIPQRIVGKLSIQKNLCVHLRILRLVDIDFQRSVIGNPVALPEFIHGVLYGIIDMSFPFLRSHPVPRQRILEPPQLLVRVSAEGLDRPL